MSYQLGRLFARQVRRLAAPRSTQAADRFAIAQVASTTPLMVYLDGNTSVEVPCLNPYTHIGTSLSVNQVVDVFIHRGVPRIIGGY